MLLYSLALQAPLSVAHNEFRLYSNNGGGSSEPQSTPNNLGKSLSSHQPSKDKKGKQHADDDQNESNDEDNGHDDRDPNGDPDPSSGASSRRKLVEHQTLITLHMDDGSIDPMTRVKVSHIS